MRYLVLSWLCVAAVIAYIQRGALSVPALAIQTELGFHEDIMGLIMGAWFFGYAAMQIPSGWFADRLGSRRTLAVYALGWSLLTGLAGMAFDGWSLLVFWALMGMAQAGLVPAAMKAIGGWFGDTERAFGSGILAASMYLGLVIGPALTGELLVFWDWRAIVAWYAVPGVLWAVAFWVLTPDGPRGSPAAQARGPIDWWRLCTDGQMQLLCTQQLLRAAAMVFFITWFPRFLQVTRDVPLLESGKLTMLVAIGAMLGSASGGFVSDGLVRLTGQRRLSRQGVAVLGMACCAGLTVLSYFVQDTDTAILLICLGAYGATFGGVSVYPVGMEYAGKQVATVFSVINMSGNLGAALFPLVVGWFVKTTGRWEPVLFLFAAIYAAAAACWIVIHPRGTLFQEPNQGQIPEAI
jgi:MFS family permease